MSSMESLIKQGPENFKFFPKLPQEIRDIIWDMAYLNEPPRLVEVNSHDHHMPDSHQGPCLITSPSLGPVLFRVNRDAREIAQRAAVNAGHELLGVIFNSEQDCLVIHDGPDWSTRGSSGITGQLRSKNQDWMIQHLGVKLRTSSDNSKPVVQETLKTVRDCMYHLPNLKSISFIVSSSTPDKPHALQWQWDTFINTLYYHSHVARGFPTTMTPLTNPPRLPMPFSAYPRFCDLAEIRNGDLHIIEDDRRPGSEDSQTSKTGDEADEASGIDNEPYMDPESEDDIEDELQEVGLRCARLQQRKLSKTEKRVLWKETREWRREIREWHREVKHRRQKARVRYLDSV